MTSWVVFDPGIGFLMIFFIYGPSFMMSHDDGGWGVAGVGGPRSGNKNIKLTSWAVFEPGNKY